MEQDLCDLRTLSTHGFYVRMESPSRCEAQQQEYFLNNDAANGINSVDADKYDLQSLQYVRALKTENEILKRVLLLAKKEEVEKLELELQALKQSASSASTVVINQSQEGHRTNINDCPAILNAGMGDNVINRWSQFDAINFLDSLHCIEDKILQKKIDILGLETDSTEASNSSHTKSYLNGDLRHLLKALARDVVFLRQENQWLKQKSPSVKSHC
ncbi:hypothetical protein KP509_19G004400 [Ceratopteris richardii]|uniref:Uncharacterized protein n=1 Tax=Ceratopteris richardii TaxID=49495 RepID=A0A8T2SIC3_CERRI|nr:hypothetical protein KP509_19G004400 [Ceratopteris richardii]